MEPLVRLTRPDDINVLEALDLKTYHYPLTLKQWQSHVQGSGKKGAARLLLTSVNGLAVAFVMCSINNEKNQVSIDRLGVLPKYRRLGLGTMLVKESILHANREKCDSLITTVPHIHCRPGDDDDVSEFLIAVGFAATSVLKNWATMYGSDVDGYVFERKIDVFEP